MTRTGFDEFLAREEEVLGIYASAYDVYGGYPQRGPGHYAAAVQTNEYAEFAYPFVGVGPIALPGFGFGF